MIQSPPIYMQHYILEHMATYSLAIKCSIFHIYAPI
jgi:hypothetical protein